MFDGIVRFAMANRPAVIVGTILVAIWGFVSFEGLTIEAFPDPTDTQVNVIAIYPGQPAEEVERQVAIPIERVVNGIPGLDNQRSVNLFGLSFVTLTFKDGVDPLVARAETLERLRLAELPDGVVPQLGSLSTPIGEIYRYSLTDHPEGDGKSAKDPMRLRTLQDWVVEPRLLQVDGVADVVGYGGLVQEIHVRPDPVLMAAKRITLHELEDALRNASVNASGGILERGPEQLIIRSEGLFGSLDDIRHVVVASRNGTPIFVSDIASVGVGWEPRQGVYSRGDDHDTVEGIVIMRRGENPTEVLRRVRAKIQELNDRILPKGVKIWPFYDRTELVDTTLDTVGHNLVEGASLVLIVLLVVLLDLRAALIVCSVIPLSLLSAFIYLRMRGMSANLLSMGAMDFGMIVDGGVVIIENIVRRLGEAHVVPSDPKEAARSNLHRIRSAVTEVARPTVTALLIIIAAYLPILMLQRIEGRLFAPLAHTVVAALVGSLLFSVTLVPVLATFAYRGAATHRESPILRFASAIYMPTLRAALKRPVLVIGAALVSLGLAAGVLAGRGTEFMPALNEGALYITFTLPENTSLTSGRRVVATLDHIIRSFPEVETASSQLGRPEDGTDPTLPNNLEFFVKLKPADQWPSDVPNMDALITRMNRAVTTIPGLEANFSEPIRDNVAENISGQFGQIALKVFSEDLKYLETVPDECKAALSKVPGVADLGIVESGETPQLQLKPRREMLGRFGLSMADVQNFISTALGGNTVGQFWEGEKSFDVVVRLPDASRSSIERIAALRVPTPSGALVPLSTLVDIHVGYGRASINRENGRRYVGVRMNVRGRDMGTFVRDAQKAIAREVKLPKGVTLTWGGEFQWKQRAMHRLATVVPVTLVITLVLLFYAFGTLRLALLVLLNVPFALVGGAVGLWAFDMPVSIAAAVGFIALVGQAALNGVLVVSAIEARRREGKPIDEAILLGAGDRLRAVLMTAALAALGLVPAALSRAMGAETQRPIAVVIVGGTLSAAFLTLIVLPVMYRALSRVLGLTPPATGAATAEPAEASGE